MKKSATNRVRALAAASVLGVAGVAGLTAVAVNAQQPTPTPTRPAGVGTPTAGQQQRQAEADAYLARLAQNLGVTVDKLKDALKQTALQEVDAAVTAGRLTATQAQEIKDRINAGNGPMFGIGGPGFGHGGPGGPGGGRGGMFGASQDELATFLGITADQLRTELNGKSLAQVAQAHGKTRDALIQYLVQQATTRINAEVTSGRLTQAQATERLNNLQTQIGELVDRVHDQSQRQGGMPGGHMPGAGGSTNPSATPTPRPQ